MLSEQQKKQLQQKYNIGGQTPTYTQEAVLDRYKKYSPQKQEITSSVVESEVKQPQKGFLSRIWSDFKERGEDIKETFGQYKRGEITSVEAGLQGAGQIAGGVGDVIGQGLVSAYKALPDVIEEKIGEAGTAILNSPNGQKALSALQGGMESYEAWKQENPRFAENLEAVVNITDLVGLKALGTATGKQIVKTGIGKTLKETGEQVVKDIPEGIGAVGKKAKTGVSRIVEKTTPVKETIEDVTGQIIQGTTKDKSQAVEALKVIDTKKVKTFDDISKQLDNKIPELAKVVDESLDDVVEIPLTELATTVVSKSGKEIKSNFVESALKHLDELYESTGDLAKKADIEDTIQKANITGLTRKEINDLARVYGSEVKSFTKTGQPLTSVNAKLYENTRKGLKNIAREGMSNVAKDTDELMSAIYNTKNLIEKNVEAVNKLSQKIKKRGLFEKLGHGAVKATDALSGGLLRGMIGGLLPRGVGYKTLNALDLEQELIKNLKKFEKLLEKGSDKEVIKEIGKILKNTETPNVKSDLPKGKAVNPSAKKGAQGDEFFGAVAGVEIDEDGNVTFDPAKALLGMAGVVSIKKIPKITTKDLIKKGLTKQQAKAYIEDIVKNVDLLKNEGKRSAKEINDYIKKRIEEVPVQKKYSRTLNLNDKDDFEYLQRMFGDNVAEDMKVGIFKMGSREGKDVFESIAKSNIIDETPITVAEKLSGKIKDVKLKNKTLYHGTTAENAKNILKSGFKKGSELSEDIFRGGGYGQMQKSISFAETPKEASIFSSLTKNGEIIKAKLKNKAKVVSIDGIEDAVELNDYIDYLLDEGVDAVYIGGGEKEIAVINPKSIILK